MNVRPTSIHEKCACFLGSEENVEDLMSLYESQAKS